MLTSLPISVKISTLRKGILIMFSMALSLHSFSQEYNFTNFSTEEGLPQSYVYSITQDEQGYLWIGTGNGLSRYNGFKFENYTTNDSLADNFVTCGISDGAGMWFGHMNGGLSYFDGKKISRVIIHQSNVNRLTHFAKSPEGHIWVSTYSGGMLKLLKDSGAVNFESFKDQGIINTFTFTSENEVLIGTNRGLLFCRLDRAGKIEIIRNFKEIPESKITGILKIRNGSGFYVATENDGIYELSYKNNNFGSSGKIAAPVSEFASVEDIYEDNISNLWLSTFGKGIVKLTNKGSREFSAITLYNTSNGFVSDNVKTVFGDREGNIWSGNYGKGLTLITSKTFFNLKFDNPAVASNIFSFCFNQQFKWAGTSNGLVKMEASTGKILKFYSKGSGMPGDTVSAIYSDGGPELWIGTGKNGLFRMDTKQEKINKFFLGDGVLENSITAISGKGNQVWVGTKKGLCNIISGTDKIRWYTINQGGLPHNLINSVYIDSSDKVWVTTRSNILAYIDNGKVYKVPLNPSRGITTMGPITQDSDSRIWIGSNGNGVFRMESDSIVNLTSKEGLLSDYCYSIICDNKNNIWVGHKTGLSRIRTSDFSIKPVQRIEGTAESFQFNPNAIIKDKNGKIWFGSNKGIVIYDPSKENPLRPPPVLGFTSIKINDQEREINNKIILSPGNYKIRFDFLGISLKEPTFVNYQYKLVGYDQWSEITKNTTVTYNHLTEGEYKFILNASSGEGAVSETPLSFEIIIRKPVWKRFWFFPICLLLLASVTVTYIKRREYKFLTEKRILEEKVRERTSEIQAQKNEIEQQRDLIEEKNFNITSSIQYARQIQNTVLPPKELIDDLFPDNFFLSRPKDIVSGDFFWLSEINHKIVFTVADCTGHGVPGAFMSILGITLLNEIVNMEGILKSDAIVTELRERVIQTLRQNKENLSNSDGMDLSLCVLDRQQKLIQYTGALNDLVYIRDGELNVVKADRTSVCVLYNNIGSFTLKEINYKKGDIYYLYSDGYYDQFGGKYDKKLMCLKFHQILLEIHELPMLKQKEILESRLDDWMMDTDQTDDITVLGIRL